MQRICLISLFSVSLCLAFWGSGCGKRIRQPSITWQQRLVAETVDELEFTQIVAERVEATNQNVTVSVVSPLTISVDLQVGETTCQLTSLWRNSQDSPADRVDVVSQYVDGLSETLGRLRNDVPPDIEQIVPLIKSKKWLAETDRQGMNLYREELAGELFVIYAEDGPNQLRFIDKMTNTGFDLTPEEVRSKALANLETRMPSPQRFGGGPLYMLTAGGVFESSLLLYPDVWIDLDEAVDGRVVVSVPSRELLMFTGENAPEAIQQMRDIAEDSQADGDYLISNQLLIRNAGRWERFRSNDEVPQSPGRR